MLNAPKLLVVEGDDELGQTLVDLFKYEGFSCDLVQTIAEAKSVFLGHPIDLIFSEFKLTDGDAIELLHFLRTQQNQVPVVLSFSGSITRRSVSREHLLAMGASEVVEKPYDFEFLNELFQKLLAGK